MLRNGDCSLVALRLHPFENDIPTGETLPLVCKILLGEVPSTLLLGSRLVESPSKIIVLVLSHDRHAGCLFTSFAQKGS